MLNVLQIINLIIIIFMGIVQVYGLITAPSKKKRQAEKEEKTRDNERKENQKETDRCTLRTILTDAYYENKNSGALHQFQYENLAKVYAQYKKLGGNSFVDKIWEEMKDWEIIT